jgi:hypothetical protein
MAGAAGRETAMRDSAGVASKPNSAAELCAKPHELQDKSQPLPHADLAGALAGFC